jgi:hypothetical protein
MHLSTSQEVSRQHREEIMHSVAMARLGKTPRAPGEATSRLVQAVRWELTRYAGLFGKRLRK